MASLDTLAFALHLFKLSNFWHLLTLKSMNPALRFLTTFGGLLTVSYAHYGLRFGDDKPTQIFNIGLQSICYRL
jgi:hypothetical protein